MKTTFTNGSRTNDLITNETWTLEDNGNRLSVLQTTHSLSGNRTITAIYKKQ